MIERLAYLWPEIALFIATCVVMVLGLSPRRGVAQAVRGRRRPGRSPSRAARRNRHAPRATPSQAACPDASAESGAVRQGHHRGVGLLLLLLLGGHGRPRDEEDRRQGVRPAFDPLRSNRAEFYAFFLFSLTGLMLCASADGPDLALPGPRTHQPARRTSWSPSRPAARGRRRPASSTSSSARWAPAIFLYGFALIYGGTGSTNLQRDRANSSRDPGINGHRRAGMVLSSVGVCFKIAAVPMHFYTADVYQGAAPGLGVPRLRPQDRRLHRILLLLRPWAGTVRVGRRTRRPRRRLRPEAELRITALDHRRPHDDRRQRAGAPADLRSSASSATPPSPTPGTCSSAFSPAPRRAKSPATPSHSLASPPCSSTCSSTA
jgi:hypothetical protein